VVGLLGPSGAGKSMLFRVLSGERPQDAGNVTLLGTDLASLPLWKRVRLGLGYMPQEPSVFFDLTVEQNLADFAKLSGKPRVSAEKVSLQHARTTKAGSLSAGERRRLEFARAMTGAPKVLLCDEPFAGVDPKSAAELGGMLRAHAKEHQVAVLLADHHVEEALRVCDRAVLLLDGRIEAEAEAKAFAELELVRTRYLRS
jgi:lipopolysaccharide export system ATP-binding protein